MQIINGIYTLLTIALLFLVVNFFAGFMEVPQTVVVIVLVMSALIFFLRLYMRFTRRNR